MSKKKSWFSAFAVLHWIWMFDLFQDAGLFHYADNVLTRII